MSLHPPYNLTPPPTHPQPRYASEPYTLLLELATLCQRLPSPTDMVEACALVRLGRLHQICIPVLPSIHAAAANALRVLDLQ